MAMANEKVTLLRSAKIPGRGWRRAQTVIGKTGKVKPDFMFLGRGQKRKEVHAPERHYLLRHCDGRLLRYKKLGNDPSEALDELQKAKNPCIRYRRGVQCGRSARLRSWARRAAKSGRSLLRSVGGSTGGFPRSPRHPRAPPCNPDGHVRSIWLCFFCAPESVVRR